MTGTPRPAQEGTQSDSEALFRCQHYLQHFTLLSHSTQLLEYFVMKQTILKWTNSRQAGDELEVVLLRFLCDHLSPLSRLATRLPEGGAGSAGTWRPAPARAAQGRRCPEGGPTAAVQCFCLFLITRDCALLTLRRCGVAWERGSRCAGVAWGGVGQWRSHSLVYPW